MCYPHVGLDMCECYQRKWWFYMRYTLLVTFGMSLKFHYIGFISSRGLGKLFGTWGLKNMFIHMGFDLRKPADQKGISCCGCQVDLGIKSKPQD